MGPNLSIQAPRTQLANRVLSIKKSKELKAFLNDYKQYLINSKIDPIQTRHEKLESLLSSLMQWKSNRVPESTRRHGDQFEAFVEKEVFEVEYAKAEENAPLCAEYIDEIYGNEPTYKKPVDKRDVQATVNEIMAAAYEAVK